MAVDPILAEHVARALAHAADKRAFTHYRVDCEPRDLRSMLVDGNLDFIELATVAINTIDHTRRGVSERSAQPLATDRVPPQSPPANGTVKPAQKPRR